MDINFTSLKHQVYQLLHCLVARNNDEYVLLRILGPTIRRILFIVVVALLVTLGLSSKRSYAAEVMKESVQACIIPRNVELIDPVRSKFAQCLGWRDDNSSSVCGGAYQSTEITPLEGDTVKILANDVSFYREGRSKLTGDVEVQQEGRIITAQTAYVYRETKTNKVTQIELLGGVRYLEKGRLMIARKVTINPETRVGTIEDVLYRFNFEKRGAILPAWGRASFIERFANKDYFLRQATYTTCAPEDKSWQIEAESISLNNAEETGVARHAKLRIRNVPIFYSPYISFPTSKRRKSGFLMPVMGHTNVGGFDLALPYYWNIAPNYDATITPHLYTRRGLMIGGQFRYLTPGSFGVINGRFLPRDHAFRSFLNENEERFPQLRGLSADRWFLQFQDSTLLTPGLHLGINFQEVSDDYFFEDFSSNLALTTQRQLLRQADLSYMTDHWFFRGMVQGYQTLHPINDTPIADAYQRLPQLLARGVYDSLPLNGHLTVHGQFDNFQWPASNGFFSFWRARYPFNPVPGQFANYQWPPSNLGRPSGARYHLKPIFSLPQKKPWGYLTPSVELVENYYDLHNPYSAYKSQFTDFSQIFNNPKTKKRIADVPYYPQINRSIPRYYLDSGLYFERSLTILASEYTQTLEPRLFYLYVPYHNQSTIPVFDSGYMIFTYDQLFRTNRFSGFDRIGDANQLSYAVTSRWLSDESGVEKASFAIGQASYFSPRRVQLCQNKTGQCFDTNLTLGYQSPLARFSPLASRGLYHFNSSWVMTGGYVWDPNTRSTNNAHLNFHYQPSPGINKIIGVGYSYLVNGDVTQVANNYVEPNALHQATVSYAWPLTTRWSTLGAYTYNISKGYEMMSLLGIQYDTCCWAVRLAGGRSFQSLNIDERPRYNNNVFLQVLLKGLGSASNNDPSSKIQTYLPGYNDVFH